MCYRLGNQLPTVAYVCVSSDITLTGEEMKEEIQQQVIDALRVLAEKLGTTAEHLWDILVFQAKVEAIEAGLAVLIAGSIPFFTSLFKLPTLLINPEYFALQKVLQRLGS